MSEQQQQQQQEQGQVYQVTLSVAVRAENPLNATLVFGQVMGQPGADKFQVTDAQGKTYHVDFGLLQELGLFNQQPQPEETEQPQETPDEASVEVTENTEE